MYVGMYVCMYVCMHVVTACISLLNINKYGVFNNSSNRSD